MSLFSTITEKNNYYIIKGFPQVAFQRRLRSVYNTSKLRNLLTSVGIKYGKNHTVKIHKFFVPELLYLLKEFKYSLALRAKIIDGTWVAATYRNDFKSRVDHKLIKDQMELKLYKHQIEFIDQYDIMKQRAQMNGAIKIIPV